MQTQTDLLKKRALMKNALITQKTCERVLNPLTIILAILLASAVLGQSPLDQPSQKKITVGSEIARGYEEMGNASYASQAGSGDILQYAVDLDAPLARNKSQNTDSDGFLLGASLAQYIHLNVVLHVSGTPKLNSTEHIRLARESADQALLRMRDLQKKLRIDDGALFTAAGCENIEKMKELMAKYEAGGGAAAGASPPASESSTSVQSKPEPTLTLMRSVSIQLPSGNVVLQAGTKVQIVARNGGNVQVRYMDADYEIPISATDLK